MNTYTWLNIGSYFLLLSTLIPVSLFVSLEIIRMFGALFVSWDTEIYDLEKDRPAFVGNSSLLEEPG